jgi:long-chain acyl-CoA synthetase
LHPPDRRVRLWSSRRQLAEEHVTDAALSISDLVRRAARSKPDATALVDGAERLTWAELDAHATSAALALREAGLEDGDRVVLQLGTGRDFVALYLGAGRAGLVTVPVNPAYTPPELRHVLDDCGARLLVTPDTVPPDVSGDDPHRDRTGEDVAVLLYTSGTSGLPKGAMLSSRALLANLAQVAAVDPPLITGEDVVFLPLPLFHVFGLNAGLGMALSAGATTVLAERFDAAQSLAAMAAHRVTVVVGAPNMFVQWSDHDLGPAFASVRYALSGSAPLSRALAREYGERGITLYEGYGLTEAAPAVTLNRSGKPGSIGAPLPGVEVELRDQDGSPVTEDDDPGEVFVRGPNLFSGYWPSGEAGPDAEGWFATGDIAVRDDDGDLSLIGHSSELVLVNGFNVYPAEVESVLGVQPGVAEVAVVGADDPRTGEAVVAFVVPAAGAALDPERLVTAAAASLAKFKLPRDVRIVDVLPRTATGKVMKWRLR